MSTNKQTMYIYVSPQVYTTLKQMKKMLGIPMSTIIEEAVTSYSNTKLRAQPKTGKELMELIQTLAKPGLTGDTDSSTKVDEIVYGA